MYVCSGAIVPARPTAPGRALDEITRSCLDKNLGKLKLSSFLLPTITVQVTEWLLIRRKLFVHVLNNRAIIRHGFHKGKG